MKKVLLGLAVSAVFVACDSKKKDPEPTTPTNTDTTNKMVTPPDTMNKVVTPAPGKDTTKIVTGKDTTKVVKTPAK